MHVRGVHEVSEKFKYSNELRTIISKWHSSGWNLYDDETYKKSARNSRMGIFPWSSILANILTMTIYTTAYMPKYVMSKKHGKQNTQAQKN